MKLHTIFERAAKVLADAPADASYGMCWAIWRAARGGKRKMPEALGALSTEAIRFLWSEGYGTGPYRIMWGNNFGIRDTGTYFVFCPVEARNGRVLFLLMLAEYLKGEGK